MHRQEFQVPVYYHLKGRGSLGGARWPFSFFLQTPHLL